MIKHRLINGACPITRDRRILIANESTKGAAIFGAAKRERERGRKRGRVVIRRAAALQLYTVGQRGVDWKERQREKT